MLFEIKPFVFRLRFPREPVQAEKTRLNPVSALHGANGFMASVEDLWFIFQKRHGSATENGKCTTETYPGPGRGEKTNKQVFFDAGFCPPVGHTYHFPSLLCATERAVLLTGPFPYPCAAAHW